MRPYFYVRDNACGKHIYIDTFLIHTTIVFINNKFIIDFDEGHEETDLDFVEDALKELEKILKLY